MGGLVAVKLFNGQADYPKEEHEKLKKLLNYPREDNPSPYDQCDRIFNYRGVRHLLARSSLDDVCRSFNTGQ
jgi:hypothetical protein